MVLKKELNEWFGHLRGDVLAGLVSSFAVIPEVIGFCIVAGISPMMGLYASFWLTVLLAFIGGRPGMISAAAGSMALVIVSLVRDYGPEYLMATTILTGLIMLVLGALKVGNLLRLIPNSVNIGFVCALAIMIFLSQLRNFTDEGWQMYALVALGVLVIYLFPRISRAIPSTLIAVVLVTAIAIVTKSPVKTIGDMGDIVAAWPLFHIPEVPYTVETLRIIWPYAISLALVGLIETLLTAQVIDEMTDTVGDKNRECRGLGIANMVSGFFGGTCGCAMIGQAIVNVQSGGKGRLSNFVSGAFLLVLIFLLNDILVQIPLAALVAVMFTVSISTFDWQSARNLFRMPRTDAFVIVMVVGVVVFTNNLAIGVILGLIFTAIFFAMQISRLQVTAVTINDETLVYEVKGQIFFASTENLNQAIDFQHSAEQVRIDFAQARIWDESAATAIKKIVAKLRSSGKRVELLNLDIESKTLLDRLYGERDRTPTQ